MLFSIYNHITLESKIFCFSWSWYRSANVFSLLVLECFQKLLVVFAGAAILKRQKNIIKRIKLLLHLLMMASALVCSSSFHKLWHLFKDFVSSPELLFDEIFSMGSQENVIQFFLKMIPMACIFWFEVSIFVFNWLLLSCFFDFLKNNFRITRRVDRIDCLHHV